MIVNLTLKQESLNSAKKLYLDTGKITQETFDTLTSLDKTKTKKFLEWLCKQQIKDNILLIYPHATITDVLNEFEKSLKTKYPLPSKDINYYKTLNSLYKTMWDFHDYLDTRRKVQKNKGATLLIENDNCLVYFIKTKEACDLYGSNTKWCITSSEYDDGKNYWADYSSSNKFVFIIMKTSANKYAITIDEILVEKLDSLDNNAKISDTIIKTFLQRIEMFNSNDRALGPSSKSNVFKVANINIAELIKRIKDTQPNLYNSFFDNFVATYQNQLTKLTGNGPEYKFNETISLEDDLNDIFESGIPNYFFTPDRKLRIQFNKVYGDFNLQNVSSLVGSPTNCSDSYNCSDSPKLKTLEGGPKTVDNVFEINNCGIRQLEHTFDYVGSFTCQDCNNLHSIKNLNFESVEYSVYIEDCPNLVSIKNMTIEDVDDSVNLINCPKLISLSGLSVSKPYTIELINLGLVDLTSIDFSKIKCTEFRLYKMKALRSLEGIDIKSSAGITFEKIIIRQCPHISKEEVDKYSKILGIKINLKK